MILKLSDLRSIIDKSVNNGFLMGSGILMSGSAVGQLISLGSMFLLTRYYSPSDFGKFAMFTAASAVVSIWAAMRYEMAIVLPKEDRDARAVFRLCMLIAFIVCLVLLFSLILFRDILAIWLQVDQISLWVSVLPLSVFVTVLYSALQYWNIRQRFYRSIAFARILKSLGTFIGQIGAVLWMHVQAGGLIFGYLVGQLIGACALFVGKNVKQKEQIHVRDLCLVAKQYSGLPKLASAGALLDTVSIQLPLMILPFIYSPQIAGLYAVTDRLFRGFTDLIGASVGQVFFKDCVSCRDDKGRIHSLVLNIWGTLLTVSLIPVIMIILFGPILMAALLGIGWSDTGRYMQILSIGYLFQFVFSPTSMGFVALERFDLLLFWQSAYFFSTCIVLLLSFIYFRHDISGFLWMWTIKECILYLLYGLILLKSNENRRLCISARAD